MEINPLTTNAVLSPVAAAGVQALRITAGDVTQIQTGLAASARVLSVEKGEATLDLAGRTVTVRGAISLNAGDVATVRVHVGSQPSLELLPTPTQPATRPKPPETPAQTTPPRTVLVNVLSDAPNGQVRVMLDGEEAVATSHQPLQPGGRYVVQMERTPTGVVLKPLPDSPQLSTAVATAILRSDRPPPLAETLPPLLRELSAVPPLPKAQAAAATVRDVVRAITPPPDQPPHAETLKAVVSDGGQQFEAKLARAVVVEGKHLPGEPGPQGPRVADPPTGLAAGVRQTPTEHEAGVHPESGPARPARAVGAFHPPTDPAVGVRPPVNDSPSGSPRAESSKPPVVADLKGSLLQLLKTVPDVAAFPAAVFTLNGIERLQAGNVLAQQNGGPYVFEVPFPDGAHWRTLKLGIEPDRDRTTDEFGRPRAFRLMMHVPLTQLGETWIDAGADGPRLRATLYVTDEMARERIRPELPSLHRDLQAAGFADVLLDVRPAADLTSAQRRRGNAIQAGMPESGGILDVRA